MLAVLRLERAAAPGVHIEKKTPAFKGRDEGLREAFRETLLRHEPGKVAHVDETGAAEGRCEILFLPPYSPDLNRIEGFGRG